MRKRGFSLLEILAATGLLALTLALSLSQMRSPQSQQGPQAEATVVAEFLRSTRALAMSSGTPCAVGLPSAQGTAPGSQSLYRLQGHIFPRVVTVKDLAGEFPGAMISAAWWEGTSSQTVQAPATPEFALAGWQPPFPKDPLLIFLPSGQVTSNGLPHSEAGYRWLVSAGARCSPSSGPGGDPGLTDPAALFSLQAARNPYVIGVSPKGEIGLTAGLTDNPTLRREDCGLEGIARAPQVSPLPGERPELLGVELLPAHLQAPSGVDAVVPLEGQLTFQVRAWSPSGAPLAVRWEGPGQFSVPGGAAPLRWDLEQGQWLGQVQWSPPTSLGVGDECQIRARIQDQFGNLDVGTSGNALDIRVGPARSRILFLSGGSLSEIYDDGSRVQAVTRPSDGAVSAATWAPDGSKVAAFGWSPTAHVDLVVPGVGPVKNLGAAGSVPRWSPDGTQLLFRMNNRLYVVRSDGSDLRDLTPNIAPLVVTGGYDWSPDGLEVAYATLDNGNIWTGRIWVVGVNGSNRRRICHSNSLFPTWSPDGSRIAFLGYGNPNGICTVDPQGNNLDILVNLNGVGWLSGVYGNGQYAWSADGQKLSYYLYMPGEAYLMRIVDRVTKERVTLTQSNYPGSNDRMGIWSPDGRQELLFRGATGLELVQGDGSGRRSLGNITQSCSAFDWVK